MKKYFMMAIAAAAITSCSQDEVMEVAEKQAISFGNTFVENATRAAIDGSYTNAKGNLASFQVYGTTKDNANATAVNIFNGVTVSGTSSEGKYIAPWSYEEQYTQYWIGGNYYKFVAIADGNVDGVTKVSLDGVNMPTSIEILDASQQKDVLLDFTKEAEESTIDKPVSFTFKHILSKAKFTAKVDDNIDSKYYYTVSNIKINSAAKANVFTLDETLGTWGTASSTYDVEFGNIVETASESENPAASALYTGSSMESNWDRLLIPETVTNITFDIKLYTNNGEANAENKEIETYSKSINPNILMQAGHAYNFVINLKKPGEPIQFSVTEVSEWVTKGNEKEIYSDNN